MFTGIVEEIGTVRQIRPGQRSASLVIGAKQVLEETKLGDSIATAGVCLTVTKLGQDYFEADVMAETMGRTKLGSLQPGSKVNLERALSLGARLGGHLVSGHIDGTGQIRSFVREDNAVWLTIAVEPQLLKYIVEKGSIAVDGVSLTVAMVNDAVFKVSLIPHTGNNTSLLTEKVGAQVNLEVDIISKYVEKLLGQSSNTSSSKLTSAWLIENGF